MPPRTIWKGAISFGLVSIPVKTYGAISEHKTGMRMLCPKCKSPLQFKRMCPKHMEEVPWNDIVKGFEVQKGKYVTITPKELEKLELESGRLVEVFQFVDADKVQENGIMDVPVGNSRSVRTWLPRTFVQETSTW